MTARSLIGWGLMIACAAAALAQPLPKEIKRPANYDLDAVEKETPIRAEPPAAVSVTTARLVFHTAPLSGKGLLSEQVRDAIKAIDKANGSATIVKLRAFVAGNGDMRRVQSIVAEEFTEKKWPLPAITTVQVGGLPVENAQVALEAVSEEKSKQANANGLAFFSAIESDSGPKAVARLAAAMDYANAEPLRLTCYAQSLEDAELTRNAAAQQAPKAGAISVQLTRYNLGHATACEGVGRIRTKPAAAAPEVQRESDSVLVRSPKLVFTAAQLAFRGEESDIRLAYERLERTLGELGVKFADVVASRVYLLSSDIKPPTIALGSATTIQILEGLPSLDATLAVEVIAAAR